MPTRLLDLRTLLLNLPLSSLHGVQLHLAGAKLLYSCSVSWLLEVGSRYLWNILRLKLFMSRCCYRLLMAVDGVGVERSKLMEGVWGEAGSRYLHSILEL